MHYPAEGSEVKKLKQFGVEEKPLCSTDFAYHDRMSVNEHFDYGTMNRK